MPNPGLEDAHRRLGDALYKQGNLKDAAVSYAQALKIKPDCHRTINCLGTILQKVGKLEQAIVFYQKAIALKADFVEAHNNLGTAFKAMGKLDDALASCKRAILFSAGFAAAHINLGDVLVACGEFRQAVESLQEAIALQPDSVEAHLNMGNAYRGLGLLSEAVQSYQRAIQLAPDRAGIYNNLAETYKDQGKLQEAVEAFEKVLAIQPDFAAAHSNLLYLYAFTRHVSPSAERVLAQGWEKSALSEEERASARKRAPAHSGAFALHTGVDRKLRIGVVSAELGSHAVAQYLEPVLEQLDRSRFHLTLFPTYRRTCARALHFRELADSYVPLMELPDGPAAERIRAEQIDVLIDTTGHTFGGRLGIFAHRAAPVQCTYIGYWSTTGLTEMDWFFGDPYFLPSMEEHFSEGIWGLPRFLWCYKGEDSLPESRWSPDPSGTVWLGSFNRYSKVRGETLSLWARVLRAVPEAKLLLEDSALCEDETHARILTGLSEQGIGEDRVEFIPYIPGHERHMALYDRLDIALDTIPFNSATTAFDALWMSVPMVALEGTWMGGRIGSGVLKALGHAEWVAQDEEEYASIVSSLARDVELRKRLRPGQRARMAASPLCDARGLTRCLEDAFIAMYDRWRSAGKEMPVAIDASGHADSFVQDLVGERA
jgi:predicted O-linked N-acetylglucosamine transferase (SPINDLY family)